MDPQVIASLVGSVGFPIVCCFALFWYMTKQEEKHKAEMDKMSEAIKNNTQVMSELIGELRKGESTK